MTQISQMKSLMTFLMLTFITQLSIAQIQKKGYIRYNLELSKEPTEMASMDKIEAKYGHTLEMAWNKSWALKRKNIQGKFDVYFLTDHEENNKNIYVHFLESDDKIFFPIEKGFSKDFEIYKQVGNYEWIETDRTDKVAGLTCKVYQLKVAAYPYDINEWCIDEENSGFFTFYPFYEHQNLGLPLKMTVGSSIKQKLSIIENSLNISEQLKHFKKEEFSAMSHKEFKMKNPRLYNSIFTAI